MAADKPGRLRALLFLGFGIGIMCMGGAVATFAPNAVRASMLLSLAGLALEVWGCVSYARWKGYSGWLGFLGYLMVPGVIILLCLPNRRRPLIKEEPTDRLS